MAIAPDTKDWTWVLDRPCGECCFDATRLGRDAIAPTIRDRAGAWAVVLGGDDVTRRRRADRWSSLEYGCHVRDAFVVFDGRLRLMLTDDAATFGNWDQDETARAGRYEQQDPGAVALELVAAAESLASRYDTVDGAQWSRTGTRSNGSRFTVESLGLYLLHDTVHHLVDVADDG